MSALPLHPAVVHIPLGLAFVMPVLAGLWVVRRFRGRLSGWAWAALLALQGILLTGGLVALQTGEADEERVEAVVPESALEAHESAATLFVVLIGVVLAVLVVAAVLRRTRAAVWLLLGGFVGTLLVAGQAIRVGEAGGELVYQHDAGAAHRDATTPKRGDTPGRLHEEDDPYEEHDDD